MQSAKKAGFARAAAPKKPKELTPLDLLKMEIATELGLAEKVATDGWGMLTAAETGRVGGILNKRLKERQITIGPKGTLLPLD
ncbi:MAG TPA: small, acid-soluble spore protein, alpha/beta type [Symbiobacteriaceae bacterium]|nr:small, acid-soluble spore protein, alpha/beta type [Symbiobacteriaceae bacterium]